MSELNRLMSERDAALVAAQSIPAPADMFELTADEYVREIQREALLGAYNQRSELIAQIMNDECIAAGAVGYY